jgi:hypothetical protein
MGPPQPSDDPLIPLFVNLKANQGHRAHHPYVHIDANNRRLARKRFVSDASTLNLRQFLAIPYNQVFTNSNCCLITRKGCSPFARTCTFAVSIRSASLPSSLSGRSRRLPGCITTRNSACLQAIADLLAIPPGSQNRRRPPPHRHVAARLQESRHGLSQMW